MHITTQYTFHLPVIMHSCENDKYMYSFSQADAMPLETYNIEGFLERIERMRNTSWYKDQHLSFMPGNDDERANILQDLKAHIKEHKDKLKMLTDEYERMKLLSLAIDVYGKEYFEHE